MAPTEKPLGSGKVIQMRSSSGMGSYSGVSSNTFDNVSSVPAAQRGKGLIGSGTGTPGLSYAFVK